MALTILSYQAPDPDSDDRGIWRSGYLGVVERGAILPERCFRCNEPAAVPVSFLLRYKPDRRKPGALIEEQILIRAYLCIRHMRQQRRRQMLVPALLGGGTLLMVAGRFADLDRDATRWMLIVVGFMAFIAGCVLAKLPGGNLVARDIDRHRAKVAGFGQEFLATLPSWEAACAARIDEPAANLRQMTE